MLHNAPSVKFVVVRCGFSLTASLMSFLIQQRIFVGRWMGWLWKLPFFITSPRSRVWRLVWLDVYTLNWARARSLELWLGMLCARLAVTRAYNVWTPCLTTELYPSTWSDSVHYFERVSCICERKQHLLRIHWLAFPERNVVVHEFGVTGRVEAKLCDIGTVTKALGVLTMKSTRN